MSPKTYASFAVALLFVSISIVGCREKAPPEMDELSVDWMVPDERSEVPDEFLPALIEPENVLEIIEPLVSQSTVDTSHSIAEPVVEMSGISSVEVDSVEVEAFAESVRDLHGEPVRVYLPTVAGPLIIDLHIHMDGHRQDDLFHEMIDNVIADAKSDENETLDWPSMFEFVRSNPQRFGAIMQNVGNNTVELIRRTDLNRNRQVDHDELVKFLFRNNRENVAFRVRGTDYFRSVGGSKSELFEALDEDSDGVLTETEADHASANILKMDQNVDHQLDFVELGTEMLVDDEVWDQRRSGRHGDVAMDLEGFIDWTLVSYSLANLRDQTPFGLTENLIDVIDTNDDGNISGDEAKGLSRCDPHLRVSVDFISGDSPRMQFVSAMPPIRKRLVVDEGKKDQITISDERLQLTIRVVDQSNQSNRVPREAFDQLDLNDDGFLDDSEIPEQVPDSFSLDELDSDEDGKLTLSEINQPDAKIIPVWAYQVRGRAARFPDRLFGFLDIDQDRSLSTREINAAANRIRSLAKESMPLDGTDVPESFMLTLVRSDPTQDAQTFRQRDRSGFASQLPPWATQMDINRDEEISAKEFIGTNSQFEKLDANNDGFIVREELGTVESLRP